MCIPGSVGTVADGRQGWVGKGLLTLGSRVAVLGPAEGMVVIVEQCVLLLDAEPRLSILCSPHHLVTRLAQVSR